MNIGRWFAGVGLILNLIGSILLFSYNDKFVRSYAATFHRSNDPSYNEQFEAFKRSSLDNAANRRYKYAWGILMFGFMLQFIGLWIDPWDR